MKMINELTNIKSGDTGDIIRPADLNNDYIAVK